MQEALKKYNSVGCCGIDCCLCPRFQTQADSACPGCGGTNFKEKHPSCGFLTCCAANNSLEVCADCQKYPCRRFDSERKGYDSFVSHKKVFQNLEFIKNKGIDAFIDQQKSRSAILLNFLTNYNEGRSKSFFCLSCTLLPVETLFEIQENMTSSDKTMDNKDKNNLLRTKMQMAAQKLFIDLKLNNKK